MNEQDVKGAKRRNKKEKVKKSVGHEILSWILTLLVAVIIALVIRSVAFEPVRVDGASMNDTLSNGEIMFVSKFDYATVWLSFPWQSNAAKQNAPRITLYGSPKRFDVVICRYPARGDTNFVKRVVGLPGDTVELTDGYLSVNGEKYDEPYINDDYRTGSFTYVVPKKGDVLTISGSSTALSYQLNGEDWDRKETCITAKDEGGKKLKICDREETIKLSDGKSIAQKVKVVSYDGKEYKQGDWAEIIPTLAGKAFTLDQDYYFVMGDHRNNSNASRYIGSIERRMIIGHVKQVLYPFNKWRSVPNGLKVEKVKDE